MSSSRSHGVGQVLAATVPISSTPFSFLPGPLRSSSILGTSLFFLPFSCFFPQDQTTYVCILIHACFSSPLREEVGTINRLFVQCSGFKLNGINIITSPVMSTSANQASLQRFRPEERKVKLERKGKKRRSIGTISHNKTKTQQIVVQIGAQTRRQPCVRGLWYTRRAYFGLIQSHLPS